MAVQVANSYGNWKPSVLFKSTSRALLAFLVGRSAYGARNSESLTTQLVASGGGPREICRVFMRKCHLASEFCSEMTSSKPRCPPHGLQISTGSHRQFAVRHIRRALGSKY